MPMHQKNPVIQRFNQLKSIQYFTRIFTCFFSPQYILTLHAFFFSDELLHSFLVMVTCCLHWPPIILMIYLVRSCGADFHSQVKSLKFPRMCFGTDSSAPHLQEAKPPNPSAPHQCGALVTVFSAPHSQEAKPMNSIL